LSTCDFSHAGHFCPPVSGHSIGDSPLSRIGEKRIFFGTIKFFNVEQGYGFIITDNRKQQRRAVPDGVSE
jgi:hypothetical protein